MSFPSPGDPPNPGIKPMSPASASRLFTTAPPGKPMQPQAEGLIRAKDTAGSGWDEKSRGRSGQYSVGKLFLHCGLWAYCSKADCQEHPAKLGEMPPVRGLPPPPCPRGSAASCGLCQPGSLRQLHRGHPCSPPSPGTGRAARRPPGSELTYFGDSPLPVCPQGQKPVRQLPTSVQELG